MAEYISIPLEPDPDAIFEDEQVPVIQAQWDDWQPDEANLDVQLLRADAQVAASDRQALSSATDEIFRWFGLNLVPGGQPHDAVAATGTVTITLSANPSGMTVEAGTTFGADVGLGQQIGFQVVDDVVFAPADISESGVAVVADTAGVVGNDIAGTLQQVENVGTAGGYITSVVLDAATSGGADEEDIATYLDRLRDLLTLIAPRPIVPDNFAVMAREIVGVARAVAVDGYDPADHATYNPDDPSTWKERFVTVAAVDENGEDVGATIRSDIDVLFNGSVALGVRAKREVNFVVVVAAPTYTPIDVTWAGVAWPTWAPADIEAAGDAALAAYLDPSQWGQPMAGVGRAWENVRTVTIDGLYAALRSVAGLRNVTSLTFGEGGVTDAFATDSITSGLWSVPTGSGTISVAGGVLDPSSTALKVLYRTDRSLLNPRVTFKLNTTTTVVAGSWAAIGKYVDVNNRLSVNLDTAAGQLRIRKTDAGVASTLASAVATPAITSDYWIRYEQTGNVVTGYLYNDDPASNSPTVTVGPFTLTGGDITKFGAAVSAAPGLSLTPAVATETYDDVVVSSVLGDDPVTLDGSPGPVLTRPGAIAGTVL